MHILIFILAAIGWFVFTAIDQVSGVVKESKYKKALAPYGYAMEYEFAIQKWNSYQNYMKQYDQEHSDDPPKYGHTDAAWEAVSRKIIQELQAYPDAYRAFDQHGYGPYTLCETYCMVWARWETVKHGRNPMIVGEMTPKPLPTGYMWALYAGQTPLPRENRTSVNADMLAVYKRKDEASERELARMQQW